MRELVVVDVGERHLRDLDTIVDPLVVTDLQTVVWSPHGHPEAVDALTTGRAGGAPLAQVVLLDAVDEPEVAAALDARLRARRARRGRRPRLAALHAVARAPRRRLRPAGAAPRAARALQGLRALPPGLARLGAAARSAGCARGWAGARSTLTRHGDLLRGRARARRGEVELRLEPVDDMSVAGPGRHRAALGPGGGTLLALERGEGGLTARRREAPHAPRRRRHRARLDGARRLARRAGHPRRGDPPRAHARPDVQAGAGGGAAAAGLMAAGGGAGRAWSCSTTPRRSRATPPTRSPPRSTSARGDGRELHVALAGGSTPQRAYELLARRRGVVGARAPVARRRALRARGPPGGQRADGARVAAGGRPRRRRRCCTSSPSPEVPEDAAWLYGRELLEHMPDAVFDIVLLGMGPDGHTCSLFPGHPVLDVQRGAGRPRARLAQAAARARDAHAAGRAARALHAAAGDRRGASATRWRARWPATLDPARAARRRARRGRLRPGGRAPGGGDVARSRR